MMNLRQQYKLNRKPALDTKIETLPSVFGEVEPMRERGFLLIGRCDETQLEDAAGSA